jgi:hypothetical protein
MFGNHESLFSAPPFSSATLRQENRSALFVASGAQRSISGAHTRGVHQDRQTGSFDAEAQSMKRGAEKKILNAGTLGIQSREAFAVIRSGAALPPLGEDIPQLASQSILAT